MSDVFRAAGRRTAGGSLPPLAVGVMLVLCAAWGLNMVAVKLASPGIPPVLQAALRSVVASALLFAWCHRRGIALGNWRRDGTLAPGLLVGTLFGVEFLLLYVGIGLTTASRAVVFLYAAPFFVAAAAHFVLPGDRLTTARAAGLAVAFGGMVVAFADGLRQSAGVGSLLGDALCLAAGALWAAITVLVKATRLRSAPAELTLQYQLVVSAVLLLPASWLLDEAAPGPLTPLVVGAFLYQAAGVAFASYSAWFWLMTRHSAARLSAFSFLSPVFGVLAGALVLGDPLGGRFAVAVLLVASGLWLVNRPAR